MVLDVMKSVHRFTNQDLQAYKQKVSILNFPHQMAAEAACEPELAVLYIGCDKLVYEIQWHTVDIQYIIIMIYYKG